MQLPNHPIQGALLNTTQLNACFLWQLQPNYKGWSAKQSKFLMETRTAPGRSLEYRGALLNFPQHTGTLSSSVAEVIVRSFCCAWCSCPSSAAATDSVFIAAAQGWTRQSWTQAAVGQVGSLKSLKLFRVRNIPPGPPGHFQIFVSGCKLILCIPVWHMDCEKLFRDILPARRKALTALLQTQGQWETQ